MKNFLFKLTALGFTSFLLLACLEVVLRITDPLHKIAVSKTFHETNFWTSDSILNHKLQPNLQASYSFLDEYTTTFRTNEHGYRTPLVEENAPFDETIVFLGDSFLESIQCQDDELISHYTKTFLDQWDANRFRCVNLGVASYSGAYYYLQLKSEFEQYQPKTVVVGYFIGNDILGDNKVIDLLEYQDDDLARIRLKKDQLQEDDALPPRYSQLAVQAYWEHYRGYLRPLALKILGEDLIRKAGFHPEDWEMNQVQYFVDDLDNEAKAYVDNSVQWFVKMQEFCEQKQIELIVLLIPPGNQLEKNMLTDGYHGGLTTFGRIETEQPQKYIVEQFRKHGIEHIDLKGVYNQHLDKKLYFPVDSHWAPEGQEVAADTLSKRIISRYKAKSLSLEIEPSL